MFGVRGGQTFSISAAPGGKKIAPWRQAEDGIKARSVKKTSGALAHPLEESDSLKVNSTQPLYIWTQPAQQLHCNILFWQYKMII